MKDIPQDGVAVFICCISIIVKLRKTVLIAFSNITVVEKCVFCKKSSSPNRVIKIRLNHKQLFYLNDQD